MSLPERKEKDTMNLPLVILASASPRRSELLARAGVEFTTAAAEIPEVEHDQLTAQEASQVNAYRKARAVAKKHPDHLVIAADTMVYMGTKHFGKPASLKQAREMLLELEGKTHQVVTAVCLMHLREHRHKLFSEVTSVTFHSLDEAKVRRYLSMINPMDKAGAYAIQEHGELIVERIEGSYSNVVGMPIKRLKAELEMWARRWPMPGIESIIASQSANPRPGARLSL
jgi:septum formation protein